MKIYATKFAVLLFFCLPIFFSPAFAAASQIPPVQQQQPGDTPKIQVANPAYDFGSALQGVTVEHVFTVKNTGKQTLKIQHVKVS
ncbi:MAG: DUF1573 domain-containing protein [Syntrophobacteraceae bacterium]